MKRLAVVVDTHPEDYSVDLVMCDDGSRIAGVQVMTPSGSTRTGTVDLPAVPQKKNKWDITERTGQEMIAVVDYIGRQPVVSGFLYQQINQVLFKDPKMRFNRHQSDVMSSIDGDGNIQVVHPSGAYIRIGESPDLVDLSSKNADANLKIDRNTGRKVDIRVALAGNVVRLTMTKGGKVTLEMENDLDIQVGGKADITVEGETSVTSKGPAAVKAPSVNLDAAATHCTGNLTVAGSLQVTGDGTFGGSVVDGDGDGGA